MLLKVLENYKSPSNFSNPIELTKGDHVIIGEKTDTNSEYPNWIFCTSTRSNISGWVAESVLDINNNIGIVLQNYTSYEMAVNKDDIVDAIYELNGWYWCVKASNGEKGWVAKSILTQII